MSICPAKNDVKEIMFGQIMRFPLVSQVLAVFIAGRKRGGSIVPRLFANNQDCCFNICLLVAQIIYEILNMYISNFFLYKRVKYL